MKIIEVVAGMQCIIKEKYGRLSPIPEMVGQSLDINTEVPTMCICGVPKATKVRYLVYGKVTSCGCAKRDSNRKPGRSRKSSLAMPVTYLSSKGDRHNYPSISDAAQSLGLSRAGVSEHVKARSQGRTPKNYAHLQLMYGK